MTKATNSTGQQSGHIHAKPGPLTQARLKELLRYNPETGEFFWRVATNRTDLSGQRAGCINGKGYRHIRVDDKSYRAHRLAFLYEHGHFPDGNLDHKNHNRLDNRIDNLRPATNSQNNANSKLRRDNRSGFKGVFQIKQSGKFAAHIGFGGKTHYLKSWDTAEEAARHYDYVAARLFGEFALTNKALELLDQTTAGTNK